MICNGFSGVTGFAWTCFTTLVLTEGFGVTAGLAVLANLSSRSARNLACAFGIAAITSAEGMAKIIPFSKEL